MIITFISLKYNKTINSISNFKIELKKINKIKYYKMDLMLNNNLYKMNSNNKIFKSHHSNNNNNIK